MIEVGKSLTRDIVVDDARAISFMGPELRVYGTPSVLADIEFVCRDLLRSLLPEGQDSVGSQVVLDHIGAAPLGWARFHSTLVSALPRTLWNVASRLRISSAWPAITPTTRGAYMHSD